MKTWFITGCSTGLGRAIARAVLASGERAVVTARNVATVADLVADYDHTRALVLQLDVTQQAHIENAVKAAKETFGSIDVLVNNAGYGYDGAVEEAESADIRALFEVNVIGLCEMTRAVLPSMRRQRSGTIVNLSSIRGLIGYPAGAYYCATKFAIEGFSESLAQEVEPLGIHVIALEPTGFHTDFLGRSLVTPSRSIEEYRDIATLRALRDRKYVLPGSPKKLAAALLRVVASDNPPRHLLMGSDALPRVRERFQLLLEEWERWQDLAASTDAQDTDL